MLVPSPSNGVPLELRFLVPFQIYVGLLLEASQSVLRGRSHLPSRHPERSSPNRKARKVCRTSRELLKWLSNTEGVDALTPEDRRTCDRCSSCRQCTVNPNMAHQKLVLFCHVSPSRELSLIQLVKPVESTDSARLGLAEPRTSLILARESIWMGHLASFFPQSRTVGELHLQGQSTRKHGVSIAESVHLLLLLL